MLSCLWNLWICTPSRMGRLGYLPEQLGKKGLSDPSAQRLKTPALSPHSALA